MSRDQHDGAKIDQFGGFASAVFTGKKMTHYSKGAEKPALKKDCIRLYSMRFCPFAQVFKCLVNNEIDTRATNSL